LKSQSAILLVIGSGAFLARHFIAGSTFAAKARVYSAGRAAESTAEKHFSVDVGEAAELAGVIKEVRPSHILNCSGTSRGNWRTLMRYNVGVAATVLDTLSELDIEARTVLVGSAAEYGVPTTEPVTEDHPLQPISAYGISKKWQTEMALQHCTQGADVTVARVFNLLGCGLSPELVIGSLVEQIQAMETDGGVLRVGNLSSARDFLAVDDAVEALDLLLEGGSSEPVVNLASGVAVKIQDLLDGLIASSGKNIRVEVDPMRMRSGDVASITGSVDLLKQESGWEAKITALQAAEKMLLDGV
jgi:GDP-4-dehydro-6-deoxy-D-mannose reductase